jgi:hypothetical protein
MNVLAYGEKAKGEKFRYWTRTVSVSAHGGMLVEDGTLATAKRFQLVNEYNRKMAVCKVVSVRRGQDGAGSIAFEFVEGGKNFWSMAFPESGAKPLRRMAGNRD